MRIAITRQVSPAFEKCELTHLARQPIDLARAHEQHSAYEKCLASLGYEVKSLPPEPDWPDSVFVEDAAVVFDELAILARPGAESRRGEVDSIAAALRPHRKLHTITPPATLDGGDVLCLGKRVVVGLSRRTNAAGVEQMRAALAPFGYSVESTPVEHCLHLKSAVTLVGEGTVLLNSKWVDANLFRAMERIEVAPEEPLAANALWLPGANQDASSAPVIFPGEFQATRARLAKRGIHVLPVAVSEFAKAEGGVTCCSLIID